MHDLIIRNATLLDGSGAEAVSADVVADRGTITEITGAMPGRLIRGAQHAPASALN